MPGETVIRHLSRHQLTVDGALALTLLVARTTLGFDTLMTFWIVVGMIGAISLRRLSPAIALGIVWCTVAIQLASLSSPDIANVAILAVLYATAAYGSRTVRWFGLASVPLGAALATGYVLLLETGGFDTPSGLLQQVRSGELSQAGTLGLVGFVSALTLFGLSWVLGLLVATWRNAAEGKRALTSATAEREQSLREVAVEQERTRIARDMHDVVAHSLAVVIAHANGGRYALATSPEKADEAFRTITTTARTALGDVRVLLSQLRSDQSAGPQPSLEDIDRLVERLRTSGLAIERSDEGSPAQLGPGQQLAIYRIMQESLTNVLRHGDASAVVRVCFTWLPSRVNLTVDSGLRGSPADSPSPSGHGLDGMRERALLAGGTFNAEQDRDRFVVDLSLPHFPAEPSAVGEVTRS